MGMATVWVFGNEEDIKMKFPAVPYTKGYLDYGGSAYGTEDVKPQVNHYWSSDD